MHPARRMLALIPLERVTAMAGWGARAACKDLDPDQFFPDHRGMTAVAEAACAGCPVVAECLSYAARSDAWRWGIWGGTSELQRESMNRLDVLREPVVA